MSSSATETAEVRHRFDGVHPSGNEDGLYYGACRCGHTGEPAPKDDAWDDIAEHIWNAPGGLREAFADYRARRALLN